MAEQQKLTPAEREALRGLLLLCDTALASLRKPLIFAGNNDRVGAVRTRTGADVLREAAAILGPLCGIEAKKEVGRG